MQEKVGYQEPREDVARSFKAKVPQGQGRYSVYESPNKVRTSREAGVAVSPLRNHVERADKFSLDPTYGPGGARRPMDQRDARLNPHKSPYSAAAWRGSPSERQRPSVVPHTQTHPHHEGYGKGHFIPRHEREHPDCAGFVSAGANTGAGHGLRSGCGSFAKLTPKPSHSRGESHAGDLQADNPYKVGSFDNSYGGGHHVSPAVKASYYNPNPGVAGVHYGTRNMGVPTDGSKYLPKQEEMILGYNAPVPDYGNGAYTSPIKAMVHAKYGLGHSFQERGRDLAGYGAFVSPHSGVY